MRLPEPWERYLQNGFDLRDFYSELEEFLDQFETIIPDKSQIFAVFHEVNPDQVRCVLFGEDPYPRKTSACGIAFWDREIEDWSQKTNGNALKNILKALLVAKGWADYNTTLEECRTIAKKKRIKSPPQLFRSWLDQGVFLVNTALTFSGFDDKALHGRFWKPFFRNFIVKMNRREPSPYYILWGNRAWKWESQIRETIDDESKIIMQNHPTFIHQFLNKKHIHYSPFRELAEQTAIKWL